MAGGKHECGAPGLGDQMARAEGLPLRGLGLPSAGILTGEPDAIRRLTEAVGFRYAWDEETRTWAHASGVVIATPEGRIARYLYGIEYAPKDLRLGLVESSEGRIGSAVDHALLFCYRYDPVRGRYGATVMGLVRAGGALTVLALGSFVLTMLRRERRAAAESR